MPFVLQYLSARYLGILSRESVRYSRVIGVLCRSYMFRSLYWRQEAARVILLACSLPTVDRGSSLSMVSDKDMNCQLITLASYIGTLAIRGLKHTRPQGAWGRERARKPLRVVCHRCLASGVSVWHARMNTTQAQRPTPREARGKCAPVDLLPT